MMACLLLLIACGQSYEETKRQNRQQRREAMRRDSAALKIAVMPTLDCLPLYVAEYYQLFDTINGGVRLKYFKAQIDCDTAIERKHSRIHQLKQLDDKMIAMTRFSVTDMLSDLIVDSMKLRDEHVFRVQMNDLNVRMQMLQNNEMDAFFFTEPQATMARNAKNPVLLDTRTLDMQMGVIVFREKEMRRPERHRQLDLFVKAYNAACDSINKYGVKQYRELIVKKCGVENAVVDSLPKDISYRHAIGPRQKDIDRVEKWLNKK